MKRRSVEGAHLFAQEVAEKCCISDLGGLLLDDRGNFTTAIEALELEPSETGQNLSSLLDANGLTPLFYRNAQFAENLGLPFCILAHIRGTSNIHVYQVIPEKHGVLTCSSHEILTEAGFLQWWQERKKTKQVKPYRQELTQRAETSYFDNLLERHDLKWGGNIDGYLMGYHSGAFRIRGIIENRFTKKVALSQYDPNAFFRYGGGDYNTWQPLITLKDSLQVPLFVMTYSKRDGEENQVGITQILGQTRESGLQYVQDEEGNPIRPCDRIFQNPEDIQSWILENT